MLDEECYGRIRGFEYQRNEINFGRWNDKKSQLMPDSVAVARLRDIIEKEFPLLVTNNFAIQFDK